MAGDTKTQNKPVTGSIAEITKTVKDADTKRSFFPISAEMKLMFNNEKNTVALIVKDKFNDVRCMDLYMAFYGPGSEKLKAALSFVAKIEREKANAVDLG